LQSPPSRPVRSFSKTIHRRRHALLGTACALGLVMAPLAGSAVVIAVTNERPPALVPAQLTAQPSAGGELASAQPPSTAVAPASEPPVSPTVASPQPQRDTRRVRNGR
jgi:hypothetical protein